MRFTELLEQIAETLRQILSALLVLVLFIVLVILKLIYVAVSIAPFLLKLIIVGAWLVSIVVSMYSVWRVFDLMAAGFGGFLAAIALTLPVVLFPSKEDSYGGLIVAIIYAGMCYALSEMAAQNDWVRSLFALSLPIVVTVILISKLYDGRADNERHAKQVGQVEQ